MPYLIYQSFFQLKYSKVNSKHYDFTLKYFSVYYYTHKAFSYTRLITMLLWHSNNNSFISFNILSIISFPQSSSQLFLVVLFRHGSKKCPHVVFDCMSFKSLNGEQFFPPLFYLYHWLRETGCPVEWSTFWLYLTSSSLCLWVCAFVFYIYFNSKSFNMFGWNILGFASCYITLGKRNTNVWVFQVQWC